MPEGNGFVMHGSDGQKRGKEGKILPKVDFSSFILSLYSSVLVQLGKIEDPSTGKIVRDLKMAKHTVDMIAMLEEKTRGNLDKEEERLIKTLLSEIRIVYVKESKS